MSIFKKRTSIDTISNGRSQQTIYRRTYIIHHYCPHTFNIGDHFVIQSIRTHLKKYLPEAIFIPKACAHNRGWGQPTRLEGENINLSNRYADAVIVGGSDQYNNWGLRIRKEEIVKLVPPLFLVGLGVSSRSIHEPPFIEKKSYYEDIRATNKKARLSSVRDLLTQTFLQQCGYDRSIVTGCPSMYLFDEPFHFDRTGCIALTFPFPVIRTGDRSSFQRLIDTMKELLKATKQFNMKAVITCHDDRDVFVAQELFGEEEIFFTNSVHEFCDFYSHSAMVVGSRLHASIVATGLGKPFININIDARGKGFTETFGLHNWNIDIDDPHLVPRIINQMKEVISGDLSVFQELFTIKTAYKNTYMRFMKDVAEHIRTRAGNRK